MGLRSYTSTRPWLSYESSESNNVKKLMFLWHKYFAHGVGELPEEDVALVEGPAPNPVGTDTFAVYDLRR